LKDIINSRVSLSDLLRPLSGQHFGIMAEKIREFIGRVSAAPARLSVMASYYEST